MAKALLTSVGWGRRRLRAPLLACLGWVVPATACGCLDVEDLEPCQHPIVVVTVGLGTQAELIPEGSNFQLSFTPSAGTPFQCEVQNYLDDSPIQSCTPASVSLQIDGELGRQYVGRVEQFDIGATAEWADITVSVNGDTVVAERVTPETSMTLVEPDDSETDVGRKCQYYSCSDAGYSIRIAPGSL